MIATINLRPVRHFSYNIVNNLIFEAKMHKIKIQQYKLYSMLLLIAILSKNNIAMAEEISENSFSINTLDLWKSIETYTFPTAYMFLEIFRMKPYVIQYLKIKTQN